MTDTSPAEPKKRNPKKLIAQLREHVAQANDLMTELARDHQIQVDISTHTITRYGDVCLHNDIRIERVAQMM